MTCEPRAGRSCARSAVGSVLAARVLRACTGCASVVRVSSLDSDAVSYFDAAHDTVRDGVDLPM